MMRVISMVALCVCVAAAASAQPPGRGPALPDGPPRDEAFRMVDAYVISNLQESLGLSDEQFVKLLPLVKKLQTERRNVAQRHMQALATLRRLLASGAPNEARVTDLVKELKSVESEEPVLMRKHMDAIDAALSPVQQAKFRILEVEVGRRIRELTAQIRRQNRPKEPGPGVPQGRND